MRGRTSRIYIRCVRIGNRRPSPRNLPMSRPAPRLPHARALQRDATPHGAIQSIRSAAMSTIDRFASTLPSRTAVDTSTGFTLHQIGEIRCRGSSSGRSDVGASSPNEPILHTFFRIANGAEHLARRRPARERQTNPPAPQFVGIPNERSHRQTVPDLRPLLHTPRTVSRTSEPTKQSQWQSGERMQQLPDVLTRPSPPIIPRRTPVPRPTGCPHEPTKQANGNLTRVFS
jgi:hypothetical protein